MDVAEQIARDALAFDPLPSSQWLKIDNDDGILISVKYSEELSRLLRNIPGSKWIPEHKHWRYPFKSAESIRRAMPEIQHLANAATELADEETRKRELVWARINAEKAADAQAKALSRASRKPAPLRPEFLFAIPERPRFSLMLESIADDARQFGMPPRCSVAQIFGAAGNGTWVKAYLSGLKDYSNANSQGSRGIRVIYFLEEGPIYYIESPTSWRNTDRCFARILEGLKLRMSEDEVIECLAK